MNRITRLTLTLGLAAGLSACSTGNPTASRANLPNSELESVSAVRAAPRERSFPAYITGYSWWDNTPRGSAAIARPVLRQSAGGTGTYTDPITIAVGHVISGGRQTLDYPAGTRFYLTKLRKYVIVEDVCGDGLRPQDGPCHSGHRGLPWLDVYIDGRRAGAARATQCAYDFTGVQQIIMHPQPNYPVARGPITESGCRTFPT